MGHELYNTFGVNIVNATLPARPWALEYNAFGVKKGTKHFHSATWKGKRSLPQVLCRTLLGQTTNDEIPNVEDPDPSGTNKARNPNDE